MNAGNVVIFTPKYFNTTKLKRKGGRATDRNQGQLFSLELAEQWNERHVRVVTYRWPKHTEINHHLDPTIRHMLPRICTRRYMSSVFQVVPQK